MATVSLVALRAAIERRLTPSRLVMFRRGGGVVHLRIVSEAFQSKDAAEVLREALEAEGLSLPASTFTVLRAPEEVEEHEEGLFDRLPSSTPNWSAALCGDADGTGPEARAYPQNVHVVAFWGLKGGVGRTTTLANVAAILGARKVRTLAIDLDLDSPGLVGVLCDSAGKFPRFDQLIEEAQRLNHTSLVRKAEAALRRARSTPSLDVLGPEVADEEFVHALLGPLSPDRLYRGQTPTLRRVVLAAAEAAGAEVVLLDSRSGYCEESAMAVLDLADSVVVFASPTPSTFPSLATGLLAMERVARNSGRLQVAHTVAAMLPAGDDARRRVTGALEDSLTDLQERIAEEFGDEARVLPPDLPVIVIDYDERVAEARDAVGAAVLSGYAQLADRLRPTHRPPSAASQAHFESVLRELRLPPLAVEDAGEGALRHFLRTSAMETFRRRSEMLVLGAKGSGKSTLFRAALSHPGLVGLPEGAGGGPTDPPQVVDGWSRPRGEDAVISVDVLRKLAIGANAQHWSSYWSVIGLCQICRRIESLRSALSIWASIVDLRGEALLNGIREMAGRTFDLSRIWETLNRCLGGKTLFLMFDDLDIALGVDRASEPLRNAMIAGLLDLVATQLYRYDAVAPKVFLRPDLWRRVDVQDGAKLFGSALLLRWGESDLWRLILQVMDQGSSEWSALRPGGDAGTASEMTDEQVARALVPLWGERMGEGVSQTRTLGWLANRLRDGRGNLFPRAALKLLDAAVLEQRRSGVYTRALLSPSALRKAAVEAAALRLAELKNESDEREWSQIGALRGIRSPFSEAELATHLSKHNLSGNSVSLPDLEELGVLEQKSDGRYRVPDLYAMAPELGIVRVGRR